MDRAEGLEESIWIRAAGLESPPGSYRSLIRLRRLTRVDSGVECTGIDIVVSGAPEVWQSGRLHWS